MIDRILLFIHFFNSKTIDLNTNLNYIWFNCENYEIKNILKYNINFIPEFMNKILYEKILLYEGIK